MHGFELKRESRLAELNALAQYFVHSATGAQVLSLMNDDENKVFGITFPTPPNDSTGVPHILEHSVLGGSRKYPLKEPFVELLKGSLNTFLNAFTMADKTSYPVASQNLQDYYNLVDVYLDAVFNPLLTPYHLQQEGWHFELDDVSQPLTFKGVVFNEMKGAYSSPDSVLYRLSRQSLFPDNAYGFDSGGDPVAIPDLTYEHFKSFHESFYHPSNAFIFFYGDDDPEERLRLLSPYLDGVEATEVKAEVALQPRFAKPWVIERGYVVDAADGNANAEKAMVQVNWLLPENVDVTETLTLSLLSHALVGTAAGPLRKALIDSGLGESVTGGGLSTWTRQMTFGIGLKGVEPARTADVEQLVLDTMVRLAGEGIDRETIDASLNTIEFGLRENNTGSFPRGLSLMMRALTVWVNGRDPLAALAYEAPLGRVRESLEADGELVKALLRQHLVENAHRVTVILKPDGQLGRQRELEERERLDSARSQMSEAELQALLENAQELKRRQEAHDSPEALALLPRLELSDLEHEIKRIPLARSESGGSQILFHDLFTNGIVYLDIGFNLKRLAASQLPLVKLLGRALLGMGTTDQDFVRLAQRIGRYTGGIRPATFTSTLQTGTSSAAWMFLRGKATVGQFDQLLAILRDILYEVQFDNRDRFRQIVLETKAGREASLIPSGQGVVDSRLRAHFDEAGWASEQMGGISYLMSLRQLAEQLDRDWPAALSSLRRAWQLLLARENMVFNVTIDEESWNRLQPQIFDFVEALPSSDAPDAIWESGLGGQNEGLTIPARVNYVSKGANLYQLGYHFHGSATAITRYLRTSWLWERVRVRGGAYGTYCNLDRQSGVLTFRSYRDPNLLPTLEVFDQSAEFLRQLELSQDELVKGIIGAIGVLDAYQLPDAKGYTSLLRALIGQDDESRQQWRDELLATTATDFYEFADALAQVRDHGLVVVMGSAEAVASANAGRNDWLRVTKVL